MIKVIVETKAHGEYHVDVESNGSAVEITVDTAILIDAICRNETFKDEGVSEERAFRGIMLAITQLAQCDAKIAKVGEEEHDEEIQN